MSQLHFQKVNHYIVKDYFYKLKELLILLRRLHVKALDLQCLRKGYDFFVAFRFKLKTNLNIIHRFTCLNYLLLYLNVHVIS
jgi:hypothetical protein